MSKKVSVIVATFNRAGVIGDTITSILNQTYKNIELVIVSDGSTDNTEQIIREFDDKRLKFYSIENSGRPSIPRNYAIKYSTGDYIAICDDDDIWERNKLELQIGELERFPNIKCVASDCSTFGDDKKYKFKIDFRGKAYIDLSLNDLIKENKIVNSTLVFSKDLLESIGQYNENKEFAFIEDWEFVLRVADKTNVRVLNRKLIKYRVMPNRRNNLNISMNLLNLVDVYKANTKISRIKFKNAYSVRLYNLGQEYLKLGDKTGLVYLKLALCNSYNLVISLKSIIILINWRKK